MNIKHKSHFTTLYNICPVCGYDGLDEPPYDIDEVPSYEICSCCGFEYGFDEEGYYFEEYRDKWIKDGWKWSSPDKKPDNWDNIKQLCNIIKLMPFDKMNILQARDGLLRFYNVNTLFIDRNDVKRMEPCYLHISEVFKVKLKENDDPKLLITIIEDDKKRYDMPISLMFLVYQRLIELQPQKENVLEFIYYLEPVSGPDWEEEIDAMKKSIAEDNMPEAVGIALKVDYNKYQNCE
ncbi:hypothetical protein ACSAZL_14425 [Methanosarcina sp. T3]|uniref:hypothetical protein n=1 Tax=Methanosarcina sp. T3 TaxID=3439062 RepID=UPI003F87747F